MDAILIKPHHFVDILVTLGHGQSEFPPHPHGHALYRVAHEILENPAVLLQFEPGADAICEPCSHIHREITDHRRVADREKHLRLGVGKFLELDGC